MQWGIISAPKADTNVQKPEILKLRCIEFFGTRKNFSSNPRKLMTDFPAVKPISAESKIVELLHYT